MSLVWTSELLNASDNPDEDLKIRKLTEVGKNQSVKFSVSFNSSNEALRMAEMGFTQNTTIKVIRNDGKNPLIIETKNVKLMIARKLAEIIFVVM